MKLKNLKFFFPIFALIFLNNCGGGGGGGGASYVGMSSGTSLAYTSSIATDFQARAEFDNINFDATSSVTPYETINLHKALAYGLSGAGKTIMIMDSRFDTSHAEFADKTITTHGTLATASDDFNGGYHGNFVAGIAAADYNQNSDPTGLDVPSYSDPTGDVNGIMGVAHNADLFLLDYTKINGEDNYGLAWKKGLNAASSAIVSNNSWGVEVTIDTVKTYASNNGVSNAFAAGNYYHNAGLTMTNEANFQLYIDALDNFQNHGAIVFALSNDTTFSNADISAGLPELFPKLADAWITVGNTEVLGASGNHTYVRKGAICGDTAAYCLQADGFEIFSLANTISGTSYNQGVTDVDQSTKKSGTSFSAPQVSGAIALLSEAFPSASPAQLVDRLLASADNSFFTATGNTTFSNGVTHGYHSTWGHGMLDIYAALQPITTSRMGRSILVGSSTQDSKIYSLERSNIKVPRLFGDVFEKNFINTKGVFHDAMYGTFNYDYSQSFLREKDLNMKEKLENHFSSNKSIYSTQRTGLKTNLISRYNSSPLNKVYEPEFFFKSNLTPTRGIINSYNLPLEITSGFISTNDKITSRGFNDGFNVPFLPKITSDSNNTHSYSSGIFLDDLNNSSISLFYNENEKGINTNGALLKTDLIGSSLLLGYSNEDQGFLGATSEGAFEKSQSTPTNFLGHSINKKISDKLSFSSLISVGHTNMRGFENTLISDIDDIYSSSWGTNFTYQTNDRDTLSLSFSQPHRVEKGNANILVPKVHNLNGTLNYDKRKINLQPSGRETNFSIRLDKQLSEYSSASIENILTKDYMHNSDNGLDNTLFLSFKSVF